MALQISTGYGSLVALGISVGDALAIISLAKRVGNWWNADSGDTEFLALLDEDEYNIFKRQGLIDLLAFNKRWGGTMRILANDQPSTFEGEHAQNALGQLRRFTAVMMCVVASLDVFTIMNVTATIIKRVLKELLRPTERGEDLLASQFQNRLNAWRSSARVRCLQEEAWKFRQLLVSEGLVLNGLMHAGDSEHVAHFLTWLLSESGESFTTPSSDVAGIASCVSRLGLDICGVEGEGYPPMNKPCRVIYSPDARLHSFRSDRQETFLNIASRSPCTVVSLLHPEESVSVFPTTLEVQNRCRAAWVAGQRAASYVAIGVVLPEHKRTPLIGFMKSTQDIAYALVNRGKEPGRTSQATFALARKYALVNNEELYLELDGCFPHDSPRILEWLEQEAIQPGVELGPRLRGDGRLEGCEDALATLQSFFMGYYYTVFLRLVDTSSLAIQSVEGAWRFRSTAFLSDLSELLKARRRESEILPYTTKSSSATLLTREDVITILSQLILSDRTHIASIKSARPSIKEHWCLGVIGKRALITNSLINGCFAPSDIGRFVLLDVDVSGIPRDTFGIVRPGEPEPWHGREDPLSPGDPRAQVTEVVPEEDVTLHVEADWDVNPDTVLLCVRYKGRRVTTISPARADARFLGAWVRPVENVNPQPVTGVTSCHLFDLLIQPQASGVPKLPEFKGPMVVQAKQRPRMRYAAVAIYESTTNECWVASNCLHNALQIARNYHHTHKLGMGAVVVVGTQGQSSEAIHVVTSGDGVSYDVCLIEQRQDCRLD